MDFDADLLLSQIIIISPLSVPVELPVFSCFVICWIKRFLLSDNLGKMDFEVLSDPGPVGRVGAVWGD